MNDSNTFKVFGNTITLAPQTAAIFRHLKTVGEISGVEAAAMYKARSLTKRISEISDAIYHVAGEVVSEWHTDSTKQRYKRYYLSDTVRANIEMVGARYGVTSAAK